MADLRPLCSALPQVEPYVAAVQPADLNDGEKFLDGAIRRRTGNSKLPPMRLRYGHIMAESEPPDADSEKQEVLECSHEVEADVLGGEEDENGDRVFEICFSQYNRNYLVTLAFRRSDDDDENSHQEDQERDQSGSDYYNNDDEEEETYEDEQEQSDDDQEFAGKRNFELYFHGDRYYVVRLVFEKVEEERFLEEEVEFLFSGLQRAVGISHDGSKDEIPAIIEDKSSCALPELVESEISRKLMEAKIQESDESRIENPIPETENGSENEIGAESGNQSSGNFVDFDPMMILDRKNHLVARIVRDHLQQLHSFA